MYCLSRCLWTPFVLISCFGSAVLLQFVMGLKVQSFTSLSFWDSFSLSTFIFFSISQIWLLLKIFPVVISTLGSLAVSSGENVHSSVSFSSRLSCNSAPFCSNFSLFFFSSSCSCSHLFRPSAYSSLFAISLETGSTSGLKVKWSCEGEFTNRNLELLLKVLAELLPVLVSLVGVLLLLSGCILLSFRKVGGSFYCSYKFPCIFIWNWPLTAFSWLPYSSDLFYGCRNLLM